MVKDLSYDRFEKGLRFERMKKQAVEQVDLAYKASKSGGRPAESSETVGAGPVASSVPMLDHSDGKVPSTPTFYFFAGVL